MLKIYINLFKLFFRILFSIGEWKAFLDRESAPGHGYGLIKRPLERRIMSEKQGIQLASRETLFLYLACNVFSEKSSREETQEELCDLISILTIWYCESNKQIPTEEE
tara:strand:- start:7333 stop:7656 length:324 start_codon:yes stop_codon:yes gene_type:complete